MSGRLVGIVPAAGHGRRVQPLPCSKEILPVGFHPPLDGQPPRPKVATQYLLDRMRSAGAREAFVVLRSGKWDIPAYFRDGSIAGMHLAYLITRLPYGVPYTLDQAYPFVRDALVMVGMPDLLFEPEEAFVELRRCRDATGADVVLGLFHAERTGIIDMVDADQAGRVRAIAPKPGAMNSDFGWLIALWTPAFTEYLHAFVAGDETARRSGRSGGEVSVGHVLHAALADGLHVQSVRFPDGAFMDLGSPRGLRYAIEGDRVPGSGSARERRPDTPKPGPEQHEPIEERQLR